MRYSGTTGSIASGIAGVVVELVERPHRLDRQSVIADHLDAEPRHRLADFADPQLQQRRHRARILSGLQRRQHAQFGHFKRVDIDLDLRHSHRNIGIVDGAAGSIRFRQIRNRPQRLAQLGRGDAGAAFEFEQIFAVGPALAFIADAVGDGHADIVEEHLIDLVVAADGQDRPGRDARRSSCRSG